MYEDDEDFEEPNTFEEALKVQALINSLEAWKLEGSVGRRMMGFIEDGFCCLGYDSTYDAWGSKIPGRGDIAAGTKGSLGFVVAKMGRDWAAAIAGVPYKPLTEVL